MVSRVNVGWGQKGLISALLLCCIPPTHLNYIAGSACEHSERCDLDGSGTTLTCSGGIHYPHISGKHSERCDLDGSGTTLTCSGGIHYPHISGNNSVIKLVLCDWPAEQLDPESLLKLFPSVEELSVHRSNISELTSTFRQGLNLRKIEMTGLLIRHISNDTFQGLQRLHTIDLRSNRLEHLDRAVFSLLPRLEQVFLAGNKWQCTTRLVWVLDDSLIPKLKDLQQLVCAEYETKPFLMIMQFLKALEQQCPSQCSCNMEHVAWSYPVNVSLLPFYTVNCSYRGLQELPAALPSNTSVLLLQGNKISNLDALASNPHYSRLNDVFLDNNLISSINILEGSNWLVSFRVLSLRGNFLTEIPVYALDDAFTKNINLVRVYFGRNPWRCECAFVLSFQELMKKHYVLFGDVNDIRCADIDDEDNSLPMIDSLARIAACKEPIISLHRLSGLDILNISLAALIVLILGKLFVRLPALKEDRQAALDCHENALKELIFL